MKFLNLPFSCCVLGVAACVSILCVGCDMSEREAAGSVTLSPEIPVEDESTLALRQRATDFGDLLMGLRTMSAEEGHYELQFFIAPSPELRDQVMKYYGEFSAKSKKFAIVSQSVTSIGVDTTGESASVTYDMVAKAPGGSEISAQQDTAWVKVEGVWYRAISDPLKRLN